MENKISLTKSAGNRIIEMAWEDRTTFDSIKYQFGLKEQDVKAVSYTHLTLPTSVTV